MYTVTFRGSNGKTFTVTTKSPDTVIDAYLNTGRATLVSVTR